jgi:hypothetical protein
LAVADDFELAVELDFGVPGTAAVEAVLLAGVVSDEVAAASGAAVVFVAGVTLELAGVVETGVAGLAGAAFLASSVRRALSRSRAVGWADSSAPKTEQASATGSARKRQGKRAIMVGS